MHYHGILLHSSNAKANLERAYNIVYDYLKIDKDNINHIKNNTYPDFLFIKKDPNENNIPIDTIRNINDFVYLAPLISDKKAVIINNIDDMSLGASNAFLKILEEPPQNVLLVLTTTKLFSVLLTIISRCVKEKVNYSNDNIKNYIQNKDNNFINDSIKYLNNNITFDENFIKKYSNNIYDFISIAIHFLNKKLMKNNDSENNSNNIQDININQDHTSASNNDINGDNTKYNNININNTIKIANKILLLQSLVNMSNNTYPNLENLMMTVMYIIKG